MIGRLDAYASCLMHVCWLILNSGLFVAVSIILWFERRRQTEGIGWFQDLAGRHYFRCPWCGSVTREGDRMELSCCQMAMLEDLRQHDAASYETAMAMARDGGRPRW